MIDRDFIKAFLLTLILPICVAIGLASREWRHERELEAFGDKIATLLFPPHAPAARAETVVENLPMKIWKVPPDSYSVLVAPPLLMPGDCLKVTGSGSVEQIACPKKCAPTEIWQVPAWAKGQIKKTVQL